MADRLVLGVGNPDRGDDAIGRIVARLLRPRVPDHVRVMESDGEATALLAHLQAARYAWIIDAARSGAPPGTIHRIDCAAADAIVPRVTVSSHGFGVAEAIALARAFGTLAQHCIVYAIEAADFTPGARPTAAVMTAANVVATRVLADMHLSLRARGEAISREGSTDSEIAASRRP